MPFPPDRPVHVLEQHSPAAPLPPLNFMFAPAFEKWTADLRWSSPTELQANTRFDILGVNIYRSYDSEYGPFVRLNLLPIGTTFYRDKVLTKVAIQEDASNSYVSVGGTDPNGDWVIQVKNPPIVVSQTGTPNCTNLNAVVTINGVQAYVESINAATGEIKLRKYPTFDAASQKMRPAVLPSVTPVEENCDPFAERPYLPTNGNGGTGAGPGGSGNPSDVTLVTYKYLPQDEIPSGLDQRIFWRATTVGRDLQTGEVLETPLDRAASCNNKQTEQLDWMAREMVRRNRMLLIQGGERAKVFIQRQVGPRCGCYNTTNRQPDANCPICYGTSVVGGYDGPFDLLLSPDDGERAVGQNNRGRTVAHPYDTWTGPSPLLSQRDFVVKLNGDRYGVGPVRMPTLRGMHLQQFFALSRLDLNDIRYTVPVMDTAFLVAPQTRYIVPGRGDATPMITESESIPDEREIRGSTVVWSNSQRR
ncbi:MAG: hypothetical protein BWY99_02321 [Synergistetes bacterium ADurb.BinA166]|nr:MAG: hypothetical protein BWY99_02321 [Synergistetes bacterium ADurb.BinA166]